MKHFIYLVVFIVMDKETVAQKSEKYFPEEITREFIKDYKYWNDSSFQLESTNKLSADSIIMKSYRALILKYCRPTKNYQGVAYGSDSNHCPEQEIITEKKVTNDKAIIKTRFKSKTLSYIEDDYEYHFVKVEGKWFLEEVYLVDGDGKYEGL